MVSRRCSPCCAGSNSLADLQPTTLIVGVNCESELFADNAIGELRAALPMLRVEVAVWKPEGVWAGFVGTAAEALDKALGEVEAAPDIYACGPPKLMQALRAVANSRRVPPERIFAENIQPR